MAQQTRVGAIVPYFERWMQAFPTLQAVADADLQDILKVWEGLGYYRRARYIHDAARLMVERHGGQVPSNREALLALPGIGRYTAGGILSLAYNQPEPAVDGNVVRLFSRLYNSPMQSSRKRDLDFIDSRIRTALRENPDVSPGLVAEALMGVGGTICLPKIPRCPQCPVSAHCQSFRQSAAAAVRPRPSKPPSPVRYFAGFVCKAVMGDEIRYLVVQNKDTEMLGGLWAFPAILMEKPQPWNDALLSQCVSDALGLDIQSITSLGEMTHAYSHFQRIQPMFSADCPATEVRHDAWSDAKWVTRLELDELPLSNLDRRIATAFTS